MEEIVINFKKKVGRLIIGKQLKKVLAAILIVFACLTAHSQTPIIQPKVDERVELLSIVFRLAEAEEYMNNDIADYTKDIDEYFFQFKEHEVIKYAKEIRQTNEVAYDAVMSMAVRIEIKDGIRFNENIFPLDLDKRWGQENADKFIKLLAQFYIESKFHDFFINHSLLYNVAEKNFNTILSKIKFDWFQNFFGEKPNGDYNLFISLTNGGNNYGANTHFKDGRKDIFSIIGTWRTDSLKNPIYSVNTISTIIHEFNHSFCNPLIDANYDKMDKQASKFFKLVSKILSQQAYDIPKIMLYEILVRACVIKYYQNNKISENKVKSLIANEKSNGFLWIEELVNLLSNYEKNRDKYLTLNSFMPEIVNLQNKLSPKKIQKKYNSECPQIVSINIKNNSKNIDPNLSEVVVTFNKPMNTGCNGTSYGKKGEKYFPEFRKDLKSKWDENIKNKWTFYITLKPNTEYSMSFPAQFFMDENYHFLKETYYLDFKTKN